MQRARNLVFCNCSGGSSLKICDARSSRGLQKGKLVQKMARKWFAREKNKEAVRIAGAAPVIVLLHLAAQQAPNKALRLQ